VKTFPVVINQSFQRQPQQQQHPSVSQRGLFDCTRRRTAITDDRTTIRYDFDLLILPPAPVHYRRALDMLECADDLAKRTEDAAVASSHNLSRHCPQPPTDRPTVS